MSGTGTDRIAIIGAGVAGLATARQLLGAGFDCTLFERDARLGGVWRDGYLNFGVQVQRELYQFPDWPLPEDTPNFTPGPVLRQYLQDFSDRFGITAHIRFSTRVLRVEEQDGPGSGWRLRIADESGERDEEFARVVVCIGLYSDQPNVPDFPGREDFAGETLHNSRLKRPEQLQGKRVAVIGYGKSASDAALESAHAAARAHIVFRQPHWPIPRNLAGILPFKWGLLNRLCSTLIPPYQNPSPVERIVHGVGKPLAWFYWRIVEVLFYFQFGLGSNFGSRVSLVPEKPVEIDAFGESTQVPRSEFFDLARRGDIELHRTEIERFTESGLNLANGESLELDLVIFATGWKTDFSFLSEDVWSRLQPGDDGFYLYRHILKPGIPGLYFIGRASSVSSILTYCLQARWLADLLTENIELPDDGVMAENVEDMRAWKQWMPKSPARSARLIAHTQHYHDELLVDMGENPLRKQGFFAPLKELIFPYQPQDYAALFDSRPAR